MVDLRGIPPAYMGNMTFHGVTDPSATKSIAIEDSKAGSSLSGGSLSGQSRGYYDRTGNDRTGNDRTGSANEAATPGGGRADKLSEKTDEKTNAGPPPSFQISILELERDLSSQLARMNAEQSLSRDVQAVSPSSSGSSANTVERADPRPTREASVANPMAEPAYSNPMAEPSYANPMAERPDSVERAETAQNPATQNPATENRAAENPAAQNPAAQNPAAQNDAAQNTAAQNPAIQGPAQPALAEGV